MDVKIEADKILNLTVTKSFISLLNQLSDVFAQAAKQNSPPISRNLPGTSPFIILNDSGISVKILESDTFKMNDDGGPVEAPQDIFVDLVMHPEAALKMNNNDERLSMNQVETSANLRLELLDTVRELKIGRAGKNAIPLPKKSDAGKQWKVIAETTVENGRRLVKLLPHIQVVNHLDIDIEVYSKYDTKCDTFGTVAPKGTLSLAVPLLFTPTGEIYFRPVNDKFVEQHTSGTYVVHLYPPMEFYNILPFPITIEQPIALDLNPGDYTLLNIVPGHKLKLWVNVIYIASHMGEMYCLDMKIPEEKKDLEVVALNTETGSSELVSMHIFFPFITMNNFNLFISCKGRYNNVYNGLICNLYLHIYNYCVGIWPVQNSKRKLLSSRFSGQTEETQLFPITENLDTLCKIAGDTVGMGVCVSTSESSVAIHITPFQPGMAPICVMNNLKIPVTFGQKGHSKTTICRNEMAFFTWSDLLDLRLFEIEVGDFHGEDKLDQNRFAELQPNKSVRSFFILVYRHPIFYGKKKLKKGRFKPLAVKYMEALEEKYQCYLLEPKDNYQALDHFEVNLATMIMKKKKNKEVKIRRVFEQAPKPFVEISLLQRQTEYSSISEVEYARMLVQEFSVQADQGLINAFMALLANQVNKEPYGKVMFGEDMAMASIRLEDTAKQYKSHRPKSFYSDLHISPLMIHLSFSQGGTSGEGNEAMPIQSEFFKVLFQSVGVSITELQDVVFKLAYFERKCVFYSSDQLNSEITSHYVKQALRQLYVLVLGLDIIGNPFGLVRDLSAGVEDLFYQPFQGLVQGPEEFATGVAIGVQSMFGHAVGGAAGAVGRITGTVGKGVAALTFDSEYQRKRQEDLNRRPQTFGEGMARGVKGLGMGVVGGITGVVTKPIEGARQEGGLGFVKGVGKGLVGVVTRPVSGVVDFASSTLNSVRNVAGTSREANALRPPRVIRADHLVRPYSLNEAQGFKIFNDTERGELAETDEFITYAPITDKIVLLVTNKQLVLAKRTDVMGTWVVDWQIGYEKIHEPKIIPNGIKILLKEKKRGFLGIGSSEGKMITFQNPEVSLFIIVEDFKIIYPSIIDVLLVNPAQVANCLQAAILT
uniref:VPS13_C domain-containing protein n=1 Tax=Heterorhabditis bacteriophora TaxID=37862 RepID=A0A1I7W7I3_HETBA